MVEVPFLTSDVIGSLIDMPSTVAAVRDGYRQRDNGAPAQPRTLLRSEEPAGIYTGYLAILPESGVMGSYVYSGGFASGDAWFVCTLSDAQSGKPLAILDGASMNPYKTGSAGAVGVDTLARENATELALIGSGPQAYAQLRATATVRDLDHVRVYSPTPEHRESFAKEADTELSATVEAVADSASATRGADIVITATRSQSPVIDAAAIDPGTHITAMGQYGRAKRELDTETIKRALYFPDLRERAHMDAGAFLQAIEAGAITEDHIQAELGEVIAGKAPGRQSPEQVTVFDSGGTGIETVAVANLVFERATAADVETTLSLQSASAAFSGP